MKRTTRKMSQMTKQRISAKLKGKPKSIKHKEAISYAMARYWESIPVMSDEDKSINLNSNDK